MRLTIWLLGRELLTIDLNRETDNGTDPGDCLTDAVEVGHADTALGFGPIPSMSYDAD